MKLIYMYECKCKYKLILMSGMAAASGKLLMRHTKKFHCRHRRHDALHWHSHATCIYITIALVCLLHVLPTV